LFLLK